MADLSSSVSSQEGTLQRSTRTRSGDFNFFRKSRKSLSAPIDHNEKQLVTRKSEMLPTAAVLEKRRWFQDMADHTAFRIGDRSYVPLLLSDPVSTVQFQGVEVHDDNNNDDAEEVVVTKNRSVPKVEIERIENDPINNHSATIILTSENVKKDSTNINSSTTQTVVPTLILKPSPRSPRERTSSISIHVHGNVEEKTKKESVTVYSSVVVLNTSRGYNIWELMRETESPSNIIFTQDPPSSTFDIKAATLEKILARLFVPPDDTPGYLDFLETFFYTFRSFISPESLLSKLVQTYETGEPLDKDRVCLVLTHWLTKFYSDFQKKNQLPTNLKTFVRRIGDDKLDIADYPNLKSFLAAFEEKVSKGSYKSLFGRGKMEEVLTPKLPKNMDTATFMDIDAEEIARHVALTDHMVYSEIEPYELQNQAWSRPQLKDRSPNVLELISKFNEFSNITASCIVSTPRLKERIKVIKKFLKIAMFLRKMKDFNSLMAIISALNNSSVGRLKHSFAGLPKKYQKILDDLRNEMSNQNSYKNLRDILDSSSAPCVPFP
eukprot:TRINITY_DN1094_c0_g1_i2.p1 TRINITY_DN1094_c0_g1~~TRINITY_DN1094_c0_g1_i2.p1  ORF type:complete len:549 (-),score=80.38 TRINITY_DN1094_c0_g1_i2:112-1758(-)